MICSWAGGSAVLGRYELCGQTGDFTGTDIVKNKINPNHSTAGETIQCIAKPPVDASQDTGVTHTPFKREETKSFDIGFAYNQEPIIRGGNRVGLRITNTDASTRDFTWEMLCEE